MPRVVLVWCQYGVVLVWCCVIVSVWCCVICGVGVMLLWCGVDMVSVWCCVSVVSVQYHCGVVWCWCCLLFRVNENRKVEIRLLKKSKVASRNLKDYVVRLC